MKKILLLSITIVISGFLQSQTLDGIEQIAPFSEGMAAVRKGNQWAFINKDGNMVIDFRDDIYWTKNADSTKTDVSAIAYPMFKDGRCIITKKVEDGVSVFGFIDTEGNVILEPTLLNVYHFKDGYTTGVLFNKTLRGQNEFKLNIYDFKFFDVLLNTSGEIVEYYDRRQGIQMTKKRYKLPFIGAKMLNAGLVAVYHVDSGWEIRKLTLNN